MENLRENTRYFFQVATEGMICGIIACMIHFVINGTNPYSWIDLLVASFFGALLGVMIGGLIKPNNDERRKK